MTASPVSVLRVVCALSVVLGCCLVQASDPWPETRPLARETPAFRAPAEVPREGAVQTARAAEPAAPLTLQDALALALMQSPDLAAFSWEVRASEARALQAGQVPNPELDMRLWRLGIEDGGGRERNALRSRVILGQEIELGGKRRRRLELADAESELAGWNYEASRLDVVARVAGSFVTVVGAQRRVEALAQLVEFLETTREQVVALVETGATRSVEIHETTRQLGLSRIELQRAESELASARFRLATTWDNQSPRFTEAVGDLEQVVRLPELGTVLELARTSPGIARWDGELARGQAALALAKARRVPDFKYGVGVRWEDDRDGTDVLVDFEISLPIFDRKQGEIRAARYGMQRAQAERRAAEAASSEWIADAYYQLAESDARRSTLAGEVLPAARATFDAIRVGYERLPDDPEGLIDARRDLARAEVAYTDALVDCHLALAALEGLVGQSLRRAD